MRCPNCKKELEVNVAKIIDIYLKQEGLKGLETDEDMENIMEF